MTLRKKMLILFLIFLAPQVCAQSVVPYDQKTVFHYFKLKQMNQLRDQSESLLLLKWYLFQGKVLEAMAIINSEKNRLHFDEHFFIWESYIGALSNLLYSPEKNFTKLIQSKGKNRELACALYLSILSVKKSWSDLSPIYHLCAGTMEENSTEIAYFAHMMDHPNEEYSPPKEQKKMHYWLLFLLLTHKEKEHKKFLTTLSLATLDSEENRTLWSIATWNAGLTHLLENDSNYASLLRFKEGILTKDILESSYVQRDIDLQVFFYFLQGKEMPKNLRESMTSLLSLQVDPLIYAIMQNQTDEFITINATNPEHLQWKARFSLLKALKENNDQEISKWSAVRCEQKDETSCLLAAAYSQVEENKATSTGYKSLTDYFISKGINNDPK